MWVVGSWYCICRGRYFFFGFDKWVEVVIESNIVIVEEFFDCIYKDLMLFWSLDLRVFCEWVKGLFWVVSIWNGEIIIYEVV